MAGYDRFQLIDKYGKKNSKNLLLLKVKRIDGEKRTDGNTAKPIAKRATAATSSFSLPIGGKRVPTGANSNWATFYRSFQGIEGTHSIF
jgi:hypothetical protein